MKIDEHTITLRSVARLVAALPGSYRRVHLGCDGEGYALLAVLPDAVIRSHVSHVSDDARGALVLTAAEVVIDDVIFAAQTSRPATTDEAAALADRGKDHAGLRTVGLGDA